MSTIKSKMLSPIPPDKLNFTDIAWKDNEHYTIGILVERLNNLYTCIVDHVSGVSFDDTKFKMITSLVPQSNFIVNGNFDVWQRGVSMSGNGKTGVDGFYNQNPVLQERSTDVPDALSEYSLKTTALDTGAYRGVVHAIESMRCKSIAKDGSMTLSLWIKADQNSIDSNPYISFVYADAKDDYTGATGIGNSFIGTQLVADTWCKVIVTRKDLSANVKNGIKMIINFQGTLVPTAPSVCHLSQLKLEQGMIATPFVPDDYDDVLVKCQRYFQRIGGDADNEYVQYGLGYVGDTTFAIVHINLTTPLRLRKPSFNTGGTLRLLRGLTVIPVTGFTELPLPVIGSNTFIIQANAVGLTLGECLALTNDNDNGYIELNAELR